MPELFTSIHLTSYDVGGQCPRLAFQLKNHEIAARSRSLSRTRIPTHVARNTVKEKDDARRPATFRRRTRLQAPAASAGYADQPIPQPNSSYPY